MQVEPPPAALAGAAEVAEGVYVFTSAAYAMNSGVVLGRPREGPAPAILVDPGFFPGEIERIAEFIAAAGAGPARIVLTHSDWDHIAGAGRWPEVSVLASSEFPTRAAAEAGRIHDSLASFDTRLYVRRSQPVAIPEPAILVGSPSELVWEGSPARLLPARGHTADGLMLLLREERVLFCGDHLSDREIPFLGEAPAAYRETLAAVHRLAAGGEVTTLVPGHGDIAGPAQIGARVEEDLDYLDRLEAWVHETRRTIDTVEGLIERCDEVVFRKGWDSLEVRAEHRANVGRLARASQLR